VTRRGGVGQFRLQFDVTTGDFRVHQRKLQFRLDGPSLKNVFPDQFDDGAS
jgi:hypothetical protein